MPSDLSLDRALLLGRDHVVYGEVALETTRDGRTAVAISVGADEDSPSLRSKGDPAQPNEDAVLALEEDDATLLAVADAHHGIESSHVLLEALAAATPALPRTLHALREHLQGLELPVGHTASATTLVVAVYRRRTRQGFGLVWGDSSLVAVDEDRPARRLSPPSPVFVHLTGPGGLEVDRAAPARFTLPAGALLVAHTDGVDECHYGSPRTSIALDHLDQLRDRVGPEPAAYAGGLARWALAGVEGHPGGQDNVAVAVTSV